MKLAPTSIKSLAVGMIAASTLVASLGSPARAQISVNQELSLLVDVSGSVDSTEFNWQKTGYVNAFNNIDFTGANFAANFIYWSGASQQQQAVGWTHITDNASAQAFASLIAATTRPIGGGLTAPGSAINFAVPLFQNNGFDSQKQIIDVSGDGSQNNGASTATARDNALLAGVDQINGLPILGSEANLAQWYQNNIQGGAGSFTIAANGFANFSDTITTKITREMEIKGTPEPTSIISLFALGTLGAASTLKGKLKSSQSSEKETTKAG
ncbi:MAG: DUF1194 domain-containing protein [Microcystis novacekii Mn_MB_F_20050700_S1]|uniref:DUF1194 domain-containing protein n=1 Tax=Microcystis novacekii Mn_MB_F_20050700_S1D TaxID=2486266 RepID=A0A552IPV6_9CHRO|nr:MAG: DUF1194 domain-containing protein [Microcystis novacekii Mn_MB_F_20050700_S1D]TRU92162.1 MAG: DUF1194 domain-containing protein [Microcystis novacekii Mn_MB_F_20050700_S1]